MEASIHKDHQMDFFTLAVIGDFAMQSDCEIQCTFYDHT